MFTHISHHVLIGKMHLHPVIRHFADTLIPIITSHRYKLTMTLYSYRDNSIDLRLKLLFVHILEHLLLAFCPGLPLCDLQVLRLPCQRFI